MALFIVLSLLSHVLVLTKGTPDGNNLCEPATCSLGSPEARYPFRIPGLQPERCGLPRFGLFCRNNETLMIRFPAYGDLVVKSISYDTRRLNLIDPKNCVHEVFLNLNLSLTPFSYYYVVKDYKYISCSDKLDSLVQVPCLSGSRQHVYVAEPSFPVPVSCSPVKTVAIPFSYSPYLSDNSFGLGLTWHQEEEGVTSRCKHRFLCEKYLRVSGIVIAIVFMAGFLFYAISPQSCKDLDQKKVRDTLISEVATDKLLGEYAALSPARDEEAEISKLATG